MSPQRTVLLIDDEVSLLKSIGRRLEQEGFRVLTAEAGEAGLRLAEEQLPDVILLDVMLPKMNGRDVCAKLKANPKTKDIAVIFISALGLADHVRAGMALGAEDYLVKPFDRQVLKQRINICLARHHKL